MTNGKQQTRFLADLSCAFGPTPDAPRSGTITSIGPRECFVKTKAIVIEGQVLHVRVWMPENRWLRLSGKVKYHMDRVGFGVIFNELTEEQSADLARLVAQLRRRQAEHDAGAGHDPSDLTLTTGG